jgi:hypothetical protein
MSRTECDPAVAVLCGGVALDKPLCVQMDETHTVVIPDSMFSEQSMLVDAEPFLQMGLGPLQDFFKGSVR